METAKIGLAYWRIGGQAEKVVPVLTQLQLGGGLGVREDIAEVFSHMGPAAKGAVPALANALREGDFDDAWAAADALSAIGPEAHEAIPALVDALKNPQAARWAVNVLGKIGPRAVPALIEGLRAPDATTREWAADALGQIGPPAVAAVADLTALLQDRVPVRWWAAIALGCIRPEEAVLPVLLEGLRSEDEEGVRIGAAVALGRMGGLAGAALAALREALDDGNRQVREAALHAIRQMEARGSEPCTNERS